MIQSPTKLKGYATAGYTSPEVDAMSDGIQTKEGLLRLDGHKLAWHYDRVQAWEMGDRFSPVTIDMATTRRC